MGSTGVKEAVFSISSISIYFLVKKKKRNLVILKCDIQIDTGILSQPWTQGHLWYCRCSERAVSVPPKQRDNGAPSFASLQAAASFSVPKWNYRLYYPVSCCPKSPGSDGFRDKFYKINKHTILILHLFKMTEQGKSYSELFMKLV